MSYTYLREQGEESSAESFADIPQSVLLRSNHTAAACYSSVSETESCRDSRSGMMSPHSTVARGEGELTSCAAGSRARTFQLPEKEQDSTAIAPASGEKCRESLAKYDRVWRLWKIRQRSLLGGLIEFSETFPRWGMTVAGALYRLPTPCILEELRRLITSANESGYLVRMPTAYGFSKDWRSNGPSGNELGRAVNNLARSVDTRSMSNLLESTDARTATSKGSTRIPTPCSQDAKNSTLPPSQAERDSIPGYLIRSEEAGGSLNPNWVEWLMGWPIGWTDSKPLETDKFRQWLHSQCSFSDFATKANPTAEAAESAEDNHENATCGETCTGANVALGKPLCDRCQDRRLAEQSRSILTGE